MDPLSIIGTSLALATAVTQVTTTLSSFISAAKHVDDSVRNLYAELDSLQHILLSISAALKHPALASLRATADRDERKVWSSISRALRNCKTCVDGISRDLLTVTRKSKMNGKIVKQIRLNKVDSEIKEFRSQSHSHVLHLSVALQSVNVQVSCRSEEGVAALHARMQDLADKIDQSQLNDQQQFTGTDRRMGRDTVPPGSDRLHRAAKHVLSQARTVYEASVAGGSTTVGNDLDELPLAGDLDPGLLHKINDWQQGQEDIDSDDGESSTAGEDQVEDLEPEIPPILTKRVSSYHEHRRRGLDDIFDVLLSCGTAGRDLFVVLTDTWTKFNYRRTRMAHKDLERFRSRLMHVRSKLDPASCKRCHPSQKSYTIDSWQTSSPACRTCEQAQFLTLIIDGWLSVACFDQNKCGESLVWSRDYLKRWPSALDHTGSCASEQARTAYATFTDVVLQVRTECLLWHGRLDELDMLVPSLGWNAILRPDIQYSDTGCLFAVKSLVSTRDEMYNHSPDLSLEPGTTQSLDTQPVGPMQSTVAQLEDLLKRFAKALSDDERTLLTHRLNTDALPTIRANQESARRCFLYFWYVRNAGQQRLTDNQELGSRDQTYQEAWRAVIKSILQRADLEALAYLISWSLDPNLILNWTPEAAEPILVPLLCAAAEMCEWNHFEDYEKASLCFSLLLATGADPLSSYTGAERTHIDDLWSETFLDDEDRLRARPRRRWSCLCIASKTTLWLRSLPLLLRTGAAQKDPVDAAGALCLATNTMDSSLLHLLLRHGADPWLPAWKGLSAIGLVNTDHPFYEVQRPPFEEFVDKTKLPWKCTTPET